VNGAAFTISVDGRDVPAAPGATVAAAMLNAGITNFRTSVSGEPRGPVCGMGICFECRVTVNGAPNQRACLIACEPDMCVSTGGAR
jgi:predicted molibdopterin-dependent oxidoreductase YjgC